MLLRAGQYEFKFPRPALVMGIVNVTPDSFSDGGQFLDPQAAVDHALELVRQGAEIVDVGGESTRPGAEPVPEEEELRRVIPVIEKLAGRIDVPISIDTMKPAVARAALAAGASMVNDVAAGMDNQEMWREVSNSGAAYVLMHMQGTPRTMQEAPFYANVTAEVDEFFGVRLEMLRQAGIAAEQVVLDVGIGFGKRLEDNLQLLARMDSFTKWGRPLLLGVSRKSFMGSLLDVPVNERLPASLACSCLAMEQGVHIIRTHDVAETRLAVRMAEAILARRN